MRQLFLLVLLWFFVAPEILAQSGENLKLWYNKPATVWNEALPLGNGRLGAMVYGHPLNERIQLNEETFWSGGPSRNDNPAALGALPQIRKLIFEGRYKEAEELVNRNMLSSLHGSKYQVVGTLHLDFPGHDNYTGYYRELDMETAILTTTYKVDEVTYKREVFASLTDQVIVLRVTSDKPGMLSFSAGLDSPLKQNTKALNSCELEMSGISGTHEGVKGQVKFLSRVKLTKHDGEASFDRDKINISKASEVVLLISIATNFVDYQTLTANETEKCLNFLKVAEKLSFSELKNKHIAAYQYYFNRVKFHLGTSPAAKLPTDERIRNFSKSYDPGLVSMYFHFGRYLLISSSQPGGQPANLQGIWNESANPAWDSKYTININTEMNYWPAEKCNLPELHGPLIRMIQELSETGKKTARDMYGCEGWVAHHNTDIWRISGVVDGAYWGMWPMGGAWLSQHLWEKYLYSGDLDYLATVYPVLKSACRFYQDFLVEEPVHKWLVVVPSISPENNPAGRPSVCAGATMDNQILFDLFSITIKAARLLNTDAALISAYQKILDRLPPMQIGQHGQVQEWMEDLDNPKDEHRHISHLYGLYPGNQISPYSSPELFAAARNTLIQRGDVSTGWSMGWKVNFWARMRDGNHALKLIKDQLTLVDPLKPGRNGGTYPNFFDAHPPFQIDGNFGCTAGIAEMLLQSHDGALHFLPALPDEWTRGEMSGLLAPGGFEVAFAWENKQISRIEIKSKLGGYCRLRVPNPMLANDGSLLTPAQGENPNPFFQIARVKKPLISEQARLNTGFTDNSILYDIPTRAGEIIVVKLK